MDPRTPVPGGSTGPRSGLSLPSLGRTLGVLYVCGGLVAVVWLLLPPGGRRGDGIVLVMALLAVSLGAVLTAFAARLVAVTLHGWVQARAALLFHVRSPLWIACTRTVPDGGATS